MVRQGVMLILHVLGARFEQNALSEMEERYFTTVFNLKRQTCTMDYEDGRYDSDSNEQLD